MIALAKVKEALVITGEKSSGTRDRPRIPNVCDQFGILVLEAYHTEAINSSDVAEMLGVKLKHLPTIEQDVVEPAA